MSASRSQYFDGLRCFAAAASGPGSRTAISLWEAVNVSEHVASHTKISPPLPGKLHQDVFHLICTDQMAPGDRDFSFNFIIIILVNYYYNYYYILYFYE